MGFKIKNSLTGEFEKLPILTLKGEKGETGGVEEYNKVDYMGNKYETLKQANDANVEYAVKTAIGEFNYLDYEGQHITATDTIEGRSKSAILTGNMLVNLMTNCKDEYVVRYHAINNPHYTVANISMMKPNTKYTLFYKAKYRTEGDGAGTSGGLKVATSIEQGFFGTGQKYTTEYMKYVYKFTTSSVVDCFVFASTGSYFAIKECVLLEGDYTQEDIPYFEGMQSVKMPVLTTAGKNLLPLGNSQDLSARGLIVTQKDGKLLINGVTTGTTDYRVFNSNNNVEQMEKFNSLPVGTTITLSNNLGKECYFNVTRNGSSVYLKNTITIEDGDKGINAFIRFNTNETYDNTELYVQIEYGAVATSYEPYKTNILTVNEEVELRGIGGVKDELNLLTGELVKNFGSLYFDGSENWSIYNRVGAMAIAKLNLPNLEHNFYALTSLSDKVPVVGQAWTGTKGISLLNQDVYLTVEQSIANTNEDLKNWISSIGGINLIYRLSQSTVKTVDLSDNHVYSYKDVTHYDCSSAEGSLVPTLSVKVPTDVQATIAQQRETIQTLNSENERLNQIQEALKASMLDSQVQLMNLSWDTDFEVFTLRESIAPKDFLMDSKTGSNIDKFSQAKFIIENDCPDLEKLNSQIEYYFSKDVFSQEQFEELTDLISIVKGGNGCEY